MQTILTVVSLLIFSLSQTAVVKKKSDREHDGFIGSAKKVTKSWSPVSESTHLKTGAIYNRDIHTYDREGRLLQRSYFSGGDSLDENKEYFKYDIEGSRIIYKREHLIGNPNFPPPPLPASRPGDVQVKGDPKYVYIYDSKGNIVESTYVRGDGKRVSTSVNKYNDRGLLVESQNISDDGVIRSTNIYKYDDDDNKLVFVVWVYKQKDRYSIKIIYSDYEFNFKGDWIKRKSVFVKLQAPDDPGTKVQTEIEYQSIEYF